VVFADASGFTALTEALAKQPHGVPRQRRTVPGVNMWKTYGKPTENPEKCRFSYVLMGKSIGR
jgi:hypothetical protein